MSSGYHNLANKINSQHRNISEPRKSSILDDAQLDLAIVKAVTSGILHMIIKDQFSLWVDN